MKEELREQITTIVAQIPAGRVTTYGIIARMTDGATARSVGTALRMLPSGHGLPWHRVVSAGGKLADHDGAAEQRQRLQDDGIVFDARGRIPVHFMWP